MDALDKVQRPCPEQDEASCTTGWQASRHVAVVATRGFEVRPVDPAPFDPRVVSVDLAAEGTRKQPVRMVGVYAPTNGMTADSSLRRRAFQEQFLDYLTAISIQALCAAMRSLSGRYR